MVFRSGFLESDRPRRQRAHRARQACVVVLGFVGVLCVLVEWQREAALARVAQGLVADAEPASLPAAEGPGPAGHDRPQFRHSIVMGGVYDRDDVARAVRTDAIVDTHYRDINLQNLRPAVLSAPRQAYVSYRIGHRVFWTRKPVTIQAGETVLSDGASAIRARCGNRISDVAMEPTSGVEPAEGELDEPLESTLATRAQNPVAPAMPQVVPFFPGVGDASPSWVAILFQSAGHPKRFSRWGSTIPIRTSSRFPAVPVGARQAAVATLLVARIPLEAAIRPGTTLLGITRPGGNPPGGNPPGGNPPGGDPPWEPPCCVTPTIYPPSDEPPQACPNPVRWRCWPLVSRP